MAKKKQTKRSSPKYPMDYLFSVADKIHKIQPPRETILNNLKEIWANGADYGYQRRISDAKIFKEKKEKHRKKSFDTFIENTDNLIHTK